MVTLKDSGSWQRFDIDTGVVAIWENPSSVRGDSWLNLFTLIAQCATGVQAHPAPESNQTNSGQVRLWLG